MGGPEGVLAKGLSGVPVLLYHQLVEDVAAAAACGPRQRKYVFPASVFTTQLGWLKYRGFRSVKLDLLRQKGGDSAAVAITFDDGLESDFRLAYPALAQHGMGADFFVITGRIGRPGFLNWAQIREMHAAGMSFQSHTADHVDLRRLSRRDLQAQVEGSKKALEDGLGAAVSFLSIPYGLFNRRVLEESFAAGYEGVCTSRCWPAQPGARVMGRVAVLWGTDLPRFEAMVRKAPGYYLRNRVQNAVLYPLKAAARSLVPGYLRIARLPRTDSQA